MEREPPLIHKPPAAPAVNIPRKSSWHHTYLSQAKRREQGGGQSEGRPAARETSINKGEAIRNEVRGGQQQEKPGEGKR